MGKILLKIILSILICPLSPYKKHKIQRKTPRKDTNFLLHSFVLWWLDCFSSGHHPTLPCNTQMRSQLHFSAVESRENIISLYVSKFI